MAKCLHYLVQHFPFYLERTMPATIEAESTLTDRYQTTVPDTVRRALRLGKRDKIHYTIRPGGEVVLTRVEAPEADDPVLGQFLAFLARDMASHPERLQAIDASLVQRLQSLTAGVEVDLDAPLSADDE
ncbi:type II toxin-antitoxin system PrlF family antitoxin [Zoogloea sp.]|uniref:type II toxin-antitoxin system PrlF family antitoxin n=1 Tax=Zoogloea sp. TaxID=49181 RepID=UPI0035B24203